MDRDSDEISQHDVLLVPLVEATARLTARAPGECMPARSHTVGC